ncbi:MAG: DEAD/DEAH box helicase family protein [Actinomycetaceae bacterium]
MGNFEFLRVAVPQLYEASARAESYLTSDPRSACFYSRRAVEQLVDHLYDLLDLPEPYRDDLAARIHEAPFQTAVGVGIATKLDLVRRKGNEAVHSERPVRPDVAVAVLRELFHVMVWATFHHSPRPDLAPTGTQLDPALAARSAPLSHEEVVGLAQKFQEQDEAYARELAARDETLAQREAEIARLQEQVAGAQAEAAAAGARDDHDYQESETRDLFIDVLLAEAGWALDGPDDREFQVTGMPNASGTGYVDYVLWGSDGLPLAVVEAKRAKVGAAVGQQQAMLYADALEERYGRRPVIYYTNGYEHWLWDDEAGYPPREVQGFATRDELELMVQRRRTRRPPSTEPVSSAIAGRYYQERAIRSIDDALEARRRSALLVMATGSGKTRTVIALVDQLMRANWVKRVLFLADRTALVTQAANAFKAHLPAAATVNVLGASAEALAGGRVYVSTYPTMLGRLQELDAQGRRRFGPGFFDLVIIDEAHRSVYARYGEIFRYFDSLLVGLTATPKDEVDHNTYRLFQLEDGVPTDAYDLDDAVDDGYLVPPRAVSVGTKFLRQGIRYGELDDAEKADWDALDWGDGEVPDEVDAEALNRFLFNADTVDKVLATLMDQGHKVAGGERIAKSIIFAKNQNHAQFIAQRFDAAWPEHAGRLTRVITSGTPYAQSLIDDFSQPDKAPHVAISVDMLDTGIDVPEVANLVFFKTVHSKTKFWQMIGRGTRLRPDLYGPGRDKTDFYVFDFCGNLEFFSQDLPGTEGTTAKSLTQRIVEARTALLRSLQQGAGSAGTADDGASTLRGPLADALHEFASGMTLDNVLVRPYRRAVEKLGERSAWDALSPQDNEDALAIAGLPSAAAAASGPGEVEARRFDLIVLRRQLAQLEGDTAMSERCRETVQGIAGALLSATSIPSVAEQATLLEALAGEEWWVDVTLPELEAARLKVRGLVQFVERSRREPVYTDFADALGEHVEVALPGTTPGMDPERFRAKTQAYLRRHEDHLAIQKLRRNKQLTTADLVTLEEVLRAAGPAHEQLAAVSEEAGGLGLFVRSLVGLEREAAVEAFSRFLDAGSYTADQIRFIGLIVDELSHNGVVPVSRLFESPFTDHAPTGPDYVFGDSDVDVIVDTLDEVRRRAVPEGSVAS